MRWAEQARASALAAAIALLGFILPLSFFAKFGSLSKYNAVADLLLIYGTAWLLHLPIAITIAAAAALLTLGLGGRFHWRAKPMNNIIYLVGLVVVVLVVLGFFGLR